jgi:DNA invertase Pin-like site-specific DNA recombinase
MPTSSPDVKVATENCQLTSEIDERKSALNAFQDKAVAAETKLGIEQNISKVKKGGRKSRRRKKKKEKKRRERRRMSSGLLRVELPEMLCRVQAR